MVHTEKPERNLEGLTLIGQGGILLRRLEW